MSKYCTIAQVKARMKASKAAPQRTDYDDDLFELIEVVSRRLDDEFWDDRPLFAPWTETRRFEVDSTSVDSSRRVFRFPGHLLSLTGVSASGSALTLTTHVTSYPNTTRPPWHRLILRDAAPIYSWYSNISSTDYDLPAYVDVTGVWGMHRRYSAAWKSVDALAVAMSDTTTTTFTVGNASGDNEVGIAPRLSPGAVVKIDSEVMNVIAVNDATNVITVEERGANGTTAATHSNAAAVSVWQIETPVRNAVARQVGLALSRDGSYTSMELTDAGAITYPKDWLWEVRNVMDRYAYD